MTTLAIEKKLAALLAADDNWRTGAEIAALRAMLAEREEALAGAGAQAAPTDEELEAMAADAAAREIGLEILGWDLDGLDDGLGAELLETGILGEAA